jgi:hypothetical protein
MIIIKLIRQSNFSPLNKKQHIWLSGYAVFIFNNMGFCFGVVDTCLPGFRLVVRMVHVPPACATGKKHAVYTVCVTVFSGKLFSPVIGVAFGAFNNLPAAKTAGINSAG